MELSSLEQLGRVEKEIVLNDKIKIKVHTLSVAEQQRALATLPEGSDSEISKFSFLQESILVQATSEINGEKITVEQAKEVYSKIQYNVLAQIFAEYTELAGEQSKVLDELKKK